jgi:hypothetical protein
MRARVRLRACLFDGVQPGVLIFKGVWPNGAFVDGEGINLLTGDDSPALLDAAAVHDMPPCLQPQSCFVIRRRRQLEIRRY